MSVTPHRTLDGRWAACDDPSCESPFHFPGMTVQELQDTPLRLLLPMLNLMQPPSGHTTSGMLVWRKSIPNWRKPVIHRDYDLPALIKPDGSLDWRFEGFQHREALQHRSHVLVSSAGGTWASPYTTRTTALTLSYARW